MTEQTRGHLAPDPGDVGRRVAHRRAELGLSRAEVAERAGMAPAYVEYVEEQPAQVTMESLMRLAGALETTPRDLMGGAMDLPPGRQGAARRPVLHKLDPDECRRLIAGGGVGRVVFTTESGPIALPVNFSVLEGDVVFRTAADSTIAEHARGTVAFEVDRLDDAMSQGWSVLITGSAERVDDPRDLARLRERTRVEPWAGGRREVYIRIRPAAITGRRISVR
ncbi:helix-turn-helix domain-containing protein [Carbonactinospora thermoautotrophica]|uniref:HTH cro/C1-type domain-containing protein n=1 Tax=Carbonactinospora thermoautotrophica TaxID=1469144 RepID=A0A132MLX1_9ACTN|nr:pyridoxamine 5'-phosphate oxidase family protein [Carbonactinospora thermoautotrophica]KWW98793.1 Uncharacterized protein LI90_422 [Carbonactinospora thermoautotrophica]